jgi:hypothetical protein
MKMKRSVKKFWLMCAFVIGLTLGPVASIYAEPIGVIHTGVTANGGDWDHHYSLILSVIPEEQAWDSGDFFSVIDFNGFVGVASLPLGWSATTEAQTFVPSPVGSIPVVDSAGIINVRFSYIGPPAVLGPGLYFDFVITSTQALTELGNFGASYHASLVGIGPPYQQNGAVGATLVPASPVPEPWNVLSVIATMIPVGLFYVVRKRAA